MTNSERLAKFFEAENKRDWDTYASFLHPDVMWFMHSEDTHMPVAGKDEYMERIKEGYANVTEGSFVCETMHVSKSGNRIVAHLKSSLGNRTVSIFDFENGQIRWEHEYTL